MDLLPETNLSAAATGPPSALFPAKLFNASSAPRPSVSIPAPALTPFSPLSLHGPLRRLTAAPRAPQHPVTAGAGGRAGTALSCEPSVCTLSPSHFVSPRAPWALHRGDWAALSPGLFRKSAGPAGPRPQGHTPSPHPGATSLSPTSLSQRPFASPPFPGAAPLYG